MSLETEDDGGVVNIDSVKEDDVSDEIESEEEWTILAIDELGLYTARVVRPRQE